MLFCPRERLKCDAKRSCGDVKCNPRFFIMPPSHPKTHTTHTGTTVTIPSSSSSPAKIMPAPPDPPPPLPSSLLARLTHWCNVHPNRRVFTFLDDQGKETHTLTYQQTYTRARTIAEGLLQLQHSHTQKPKNKTKLLLEKGDRILLVFLPSLDFIVAFLGCLMAKVIPVPVFPPDPRKLKKDLYMFASIQVCCVCV